MPDYNYKIYNFINPCLQKFKKFIKVIISKKDKGIYDAMNKGIKSRDDDFKFLDQKLPKKFDVIYLDSLHEADHVEKIFYHYFKKLKVGGFFFIDDISWLPYLSKKKG